MHYNHYAILMLIMLGSGLLGGLSNYFILSDEGGASATAGKGFLIRKSLILGITASFMVPLFLTTISSDILARPEDGTFDKNYLVLAGFCLLAAVMSKRFIEGLYEKVMKAEAKANRAADKATEAIEKLEAVEESLSEEEHDGVAALSAVFKAKDLTDEDKVLSSFTNRKYLYRSGSGIAAELKLDRMLVKDTLSALVEEGKLRTKFNKRGHLLYALTGS